MLEGKIVTLFEDEEKTKAILPRTTLSAVTGKNGLNIQGELDKKQDTLTAGDNITIENNVIDTKEDYLPLTGGTLTGSVTAPSFQTGTDESAYFQTKKMRGQGDANTYNHAVDWGYAGHDKVDFYEYGGTWNFYQCQSSNKSAARLIGTVGLTGWNGGAVLTGTPTAPTATEGTSTTQIATTEFVTNAVAKKDLSKYRTSADQDTIDSAIKDRITTIENKESTWDSKADTSYVDTEVAKKQDTLVSGTNIKTLNSESLLGSGDIVLTKSSIGLGNVDNTADLDKPISTLAQNALDGKQLNLNLTTNNAGFHNSIFRGKYLGTSVTSTQYLQISAGTFEDLYVGDYWTINGVNWRIAGFDYWYNRGDTACTTHHIVIVPDSNLLNADGSTTHWMNASNTTSGAYIGSDWYTGNNSNTGRSQVTTKINNAFGSAHILTHRECLKNAVTNGYESGGSWYDSTHEFMTEQMAYGCKVFGNVINGTNVPASYAISNSQLPLFALAPQYLCNRASWWLRDVGSSTHFAIVYYHGTCDCGNASDTWVGVRVAFGVKA